MLEHFHVGHPNIAQKPIVWHQKADLAVYSPHVSLCQIVGALDPKQTVGTLEMGKIPSQIPPGNSPILIDNFFLSIDTARQITILQSNK